ncbi:MAG: PTS transporter subunit EIIC, partial [bacterium]
MMSYIQRLGKSLLTPIAVLPICGILMGIGYALCPATMQGGAIQGSTAMLGYFLVKAGSSVIDHIALIFAIGVAFGMSDDHDGTAALSGLVAWLMITTLLNSNNVVVMFPSIAEDTVKVLAFSKIENAFIGILCGIIGSYSYNHFKNIRLPDFLAFFSGKRFVAIVTALISIAVAGLLMVIWPLIFKGLIQLGQSISGMGYFGAAIYAFLNRLLIPTGLH